MASGGLQEATKYFRLAVSGGTSLLGSAVLRSFAAGTTLQGKPVEVIRLVDNAQEKEEDTENIVIDYTQSPIQGKHHLEHLDAILHLEGCPLFGSDMIAEKKAQDDSTSPPLTTEDEGLLATTFLTGLQSRFGAWTPEKKKLIETSRVQPTRLLAQICSQLGSPPPIFLCASSVDIYGSQEGDCLIDENHPVSSKEGSAGFLSRVYRELEEAADRAATSETTVVKARVGVILSSRGGLLSRLLPIFQSRGGGTFGDGHNWISWISLRDAVAGILFLLETFQSTKLDGPINVCSPHAETSGTLSRTLEEILHQDLWIKFHVSVPERVLRGLFGELSDELLLSSLRVVPSRLLQAGFCFKDSTLASAITTSLEEQRQQKVSEASRPGQEPHDAASFVFRLGSYISSGVEFAADKLQTFVTSDGTAGRSLFPQGSFEGAGGSLRPPSVPSMDKTKDIDDISHVADDGDTEIHSIGSFSAEGSVVGGNEGRQRSRPTTPVGTVRKATGRGGDGPPPLPSETIEPLPSPPPPS